MPLLLHSRCPKPFQISSLGTGTRLSYGQTFQSADSEINIQSGLLQISLFMSLYQAAVGTVSPAEFVNEAFHL